MMPVDVLAQLLKVLRRKLGGNSGDTRAFGGGTARRLGFFPALLGLLLIGWIAWHGPSRMVVRTRAPLQGNSPQ